MSISSFVDLFRATFAGLQSTAKANFPPIIGDAVPQAGSILPGIESLVDAVAPKAVASPVRQVGQTRASLGAGGVLPSLLGGLFGSIFGTSVQSEAITPPTFRLPPPIHLDAGISARERRAGSVDYTSTGQSRLGEQPSGSGVPSVVIQIQALDSRSILDRSEEIATAVREAVLNAHPLGALLRE